jgi:sigma-E factor negative regulatory protein RseB
MPSSKPFCRPNFLSKLLPKLLPKLLAALLISTLAQAPVIADTAMDWVQRMSDAMRNLNYRGDFVYMHDNSLEGMQISHYKDMNGEKERLISLNGEAREVIRDNQNLTCIWPSSRKVIVDVSRKNSFSPIFIPEDIVRLEKFYQMRLVGKDRVANMDAVIVHIKPLDQYRYGMKFWINEDNGLMMKSSLLDENERVIEEVMFTSLQLFEGDDKLVIDTMPPIDDNFTLVRYHSGDSSRTFAVDNAWQLATVPGGFWRESVLRRKISGSDQFIQQMVYTDGLASLSVFIEKKSDLTQSGVSSMGAVNAFIRIVNDHSVTAIGEVPPLTVKQVAESVTYQRQ